MASNISAYDPIPDGSEATPGLWNRRYQKLHDNDTSMNSTFIDPADSVVSFAGRIYVNGRGAFNSNVSVAGALQGGTIWDKGGQVHNVKAYGATGDGSTDDRDSIQATIAAANSATGGVVFFPQGEYLVESTLDCRFDNIALEGIGQRIDTDTAGSVLKKGFDGTLINVAGTAGGDHIDGFQMRSLTVDGQSHAGGFTGNALDLTATSGPYVHNVEFVGVIGSAMKLAETWDFTGDNIWIRSSGNSAGDAALDITDTASSGVARADFYSLHMESNFTTHMHVHAPNSSGAQPPKWVKFFGGKFHDAIPVASQIQTPLVKVDAAEHMFMSGVEFSISSNVEQLRYAGDVGVLDIYMTGATGDYGLNVTGGSRSDIRAIIGASSLNTASRISGGNHRVRLITNGITSAATIFGTAMVTEERDNILKLHSGHLLLPSENDAATPTLAFGDGDTGFYETAADVLNFASVGGVVFQMQQTQINGAGGSSWGLLNEAASAVNPTVIPNRTDKDTGLGHAGADQLSLIAGATESLRLSPNTVRFISVRSDVADVAGDGSGNTGDFSISTSHLHICVSANSWRRVALSAF